MKYQNKFIYKRIDTEISIMIPNGVEEIEFQCLSGGTIGKELLLPTTVTLLGNNAFSYTNGIENIDLSNVTKLGNNCFNNNENRTITIPHTVKTIEKGCFCNFKEVTTHIDKNTVI